MLNRFLQKIFGGNGPTGEFGQFGSDSAGSQVTTKNPDEIQALSAYYEQGLFPATKNHQEPPRIEDINGLYFLFTRQLAYLFQAGIAEWQTDTEYFADKSIVLASNGGIYIAITGTEATPNTGLEPSTHSDNWKLLITKSGVASGNPPLTRAINSGNGLSGGGDLSADRTLALDFEATATNIKMNGAQSVGATTKAARSDHVHPTDTSRAPTSHASSGTAYGVGTTANYGHNKVINDLTHRAFANGESLSAYQGKVLNDSKAPKSHASSGTSYGVGTTANYGHNKVINDLTHRAFANGESLSAYQGKVLNDSKAPKSHASSGTSYGVGTTANYGHNKVINDLTHRAFANGESLSAYQGKVLNDSKAPTSHASSGTSYGVGTTENYGHNKVINDLTHSSFANGESLSAYQGYVLANKSNVLPIGFPYIQLKGFDSPSDLGLLGTWTDVTANYANRYLAVAGSRFTYGTDYSDGLPNIMGGTRIPKSNYEKTGTPTGAFSLSASGEGNSAEWRGYGLYLKFNAASSNPIYGAASFVRPATTVLKIWKRTA